MQTDKVHNTDIPFPELRGKLAALRYPALTEIKMDGEYNALFYNKSKIVGGESKFITVNKYGRVRQDFPALMELQATLDASEAQSCTMLSELYYEDGKLGKLYGLNSNKESDSLSLHVFDVAGVNSMHVGKYELAERKEILYDLIGTDQAKVKLCQTELDVVEQFNLATSAGYEGIVAKALDSKLVMGPCSWVKMKWKDQTDYEVILVDSSKERIEVRVPTPGNTHISVGVKAPNKYKKHIKVGDFVTIEHQGILPSGSLRHPTLIKKKEWV